MTRHCRGHIFNKLRSVELSHSLLAFHLFPSSTVCSLYSADDDRSRVCCLSHLRSSRVFAFKLSFLPSSSSSSSFILFFFPPAHKYSSSRSYHTASHLFIRKEKEISSCQTLTPPLRQSFVSITHKELYCSRCNLSGQGQFLPIFSPQSAA